MRRSHPDPTLPAQGLSHKLLVERDPLEVARFVCALLRNADLRGNTSYIDLSRTLALPILHDPDGRCCTRENWPSTVIQLVADEARSRNTASPRDQELIPAPRLDTIETTIEALADDIDAGRRVGMPLPFTGKQLRAFYDALLTRLPRTEVLIDLHRRWVAQGYRSVHPLWHPHPDVLALPVNSASIHRT